MLTIYQEEMQLSAPGNRQISCLLPSREPRTAPIGWVMRLFRKWFSFVYVKQLTAVDAQHRH
jgi:hypothetical protein